MIFSRLVNTSNQLTVILAYDLSSMEDPVNTARQHLLNVDGK